MPPCSPAEVNSRNIASTMSPNDPVNEPQHAQQFAQMLSSGQLLFIVGAGISVGAGIPANFVCQAAALFLPNDPDLKTLVELVTSTIQQERFFEIVRRANADRALNAQQWDTILHIWQGADPVRQQRSGVLCPPLQAHHGIVKYCDQHKLPIITANVDCLFEAAAHAVDIPYYVSATPTAWSLKTDRTRGLEIVKFHGTVRLQGQSRLDTLCCEMETITRPNPILLRRIAKLAEAHTLCFWGYSGRDLDYYQQLRNQIFAGRSSRPFWVDIDFIKKPDGAASFNARSVDAMRLDPSNTPWPGDAPKSVNLGGLFDELRAESAQLFPVDRVRRLLTLVLCLEGIGRYGEALSLFDRYQQAAGGETPTAAVEAKLIHARLLDGGSRYVESETAAQKAREQLASIACLENTSLEFVSACQTLRAIHLQSMARKLRFVQLPILRAAGLRAVRLLPRATIEILRSLILDTRHLKRRFVRLEQEAKKHDSPLARVQYQLARRAINDHEIANVAVTIYLGRVKRWRPRLISSILRLRDRAQLTGDAFGYVSTLKYLARLKGSTSAAQLANHLHEQTTDPLNHAASLMSMARGMSCGPARNHLIDDALAAARKSGSHAAAVKILLSQNSNDLDQTIREIGCCTGEAFALLGGVLRSRFRSSV